MTQKPSIPKGTRDFTPPEVAKRNYIFGVIKKHFETFGFQPIETPSFENSDTLMGKYGDEGDRLIFKILDSGEYFEKFGKIGSTFYRDFFHLFVKRPIFLKNQTLIEFFENFGDEQELFLNKILEEIYQEEFDQKEKYQDFVDDYFFKIAIKTIRQNLEQFVRIRYNINSRENLTLEENELDFIMDRAIEAFGLWTINLPSRSFVRFFSEKALRYDLTVPFARYVVMHQNEIDFPFKRYQIQPVWRADRPQKGRFREFYQCDADVVGADSLLQEVEFIQLYDAVFADLSLEGVSIKINNRKILAGIAEVIGAKDLLIDFTVALDKLDKIGTEGVKKEMSTKGISANSIAKVEPLFSLSGNNSEQLVTLKNMLSDSEEGSKGVEELAFIFDTVEALGLQSAQLSIDVTLARGLNYYTGAILEVAAPKKVDMGSIGGGGRYDDLTGIFGLKDVSGVGISFGLDRIYLVLEELGLFPETLDQNLQVLCLNFGDKEALAALKLTTSLRKSGIKSDIYPSDTKIQKQFKYANNRRVPYVILIGEKELSDNSFVVKNMESGEQETYDLNNPEVFVGRLVKG